MATTFHIDSPPPRSAAERDKFEARRKQEQEVLLHRAQVQEFLVNAGLEDCAGKFFSYGVKTIGDLLDSEALPESELSSSLHLTKLQIRKFHLAVQRALEFSQVTAHDGSQPPAEFSASSNTDDMMPVQPPRLNKHFQPARRSSQLFAMEKGISPAEVLHSANLGQFVGPVREFGIDSLEDLINPAVLSDEELVRDIGMSMDQVAIFRAATEAFRPPPLVEAEEEVDFESTLQASGRMDSRVSSVESVDSTNILLAETTKAAIAAPSGVITLVFTDIQGSTELWEAFPLDFKQIVKLHHKIMRLCLVRHHGYEVKTEGDAFFVTFASPSDAVHFALDAQLQLLHANWPEWLLGNHNSCVVLDDDAPAGKTNLLFRGLRVRMGLYTGEPDTERDETTGRIDYYGRVVNKAARVAGLAQGGQILMSAITHQIVHGLLGGRAVIKDLGEVFLKGIQDPENVFEILPLSVAHRSFHFTKAFHDSSHHHGKKGVKQPETEECVQVPTETTEMLLEAVRNGDTIAIQRIASFEEFENAHQTEKAKVLKAAMDLAFDMGAEEVAPEVIDAINSCAHESLENLPPAYSALVRQSSHDSQGE